MGRLSRITRLDFATIRVAAWTIRAAQRAHSHLRDGPLSDVVLPRVPPAPAHAGIAVGAVLKRRRDSCLVRAVVRQAWWRAQGQDRALVIGITKPNASFSAHAWLEGDPPCHSEGFIELLRRPAS